MDLYFEVKEKNITTNEKYPTVIGYNSGNIIHFLFDEEWTNVLNKTARFIKDNDFVDILLEKDDTCEIPLSILKTGSVQVGVFGGNLKSTNCGLFYVTTSILDENGLPLDPEESIYLQIIKELEEIKMNSTIEGAVRYNIFQNLTKEQKEIARKNIGAFSDEDIIILDSNLS